MRSTLEETVAARFPSLVDKSVELSQAVSFTVDSSEFVGNYDVGFEFQRVTGEEVSPRFELFDELHPVFHRRQVFDGASGIVAHGFRHRFNAAASGMADAADIEHVAVIVFNDEVVSAFSLSPVESHGLSVVH